MRKLKPRQKSGGKRAIGPFYLSATFDDISGLELGAWATHGPHIADGLSTDAKGIPWIAGKRIVSACTTINVWPDYPTFFKFYASVQEKFLSTRRATGVPVVERLFQAFKIGRSRGVALEMNRIDREREINDPRLKLKADSIPSASRPTLAAPVSLSRSRAKLLPAKPKTAPPVPHPEPREDKTPKPKTQFFYPSNPGGGNPLAWAPEEFESEED